MYGLLSLIIGLACVGGALTASRGLAPPLGPIPRWGMGLIVGSLAGGFIGLGVYQAWKAIAATLERENNYVRLINGIFLGIIMVALGGLLFPAIGLVFGSGVGVRIAQGLVLAGALFLGLRIGFMFDRPVYLLFGFGGKARIVPHVHTNDPVEHKVLDTSAIIDGRIADLLHTGFLEGDVVVPEFVLSELQGIADSSNNLRRRKGRRGLEVLRSLMQDDHVNIHITHADYPFIKEVDRKLIHLVKEKGGALVTTDYNLNRVAQVEGVKILNINELANAVKPQFIPGEEITVDVIDKGEEIGQGVGYLDDGTMVVVENGRRHIGRKIKATVKSTLQTDAGRMLFVEPAGETPRWER